MQPAWLMGDTSKVISNAVNSKEAFLDDMTDECIIVQKQQMLIERRALVKTAAARQAC